MRRSVIVVEIPANEKKVWDIVTDNYHTDWRSDLSKVEVLNEKEFVEYTKNDIATKFTIEAKEPYKYYEFSFGNNNMQGVWHGKFTAVSENVTKLEFVEEIKIKNPLVELISYIFFPIKKMQKTYMKDLELEVQRQNKK